METIGINNEQLILRNVTKDNGGRYGCSISNGIKPDLWTEFEITIDGKLWFLFTRLYLD